MSEYLSHFSVMKKECLDAMEKGFKESGKTTFADLTFGAGGHTFAIQEKILSSKVFSVDQDPDALANGYKKIKHFQKEDFIHLLDMNFSQFPDWCEKNSLQGQFAGIIMDLGVSSHQFDKMDRGFSFREDAPLDMRMDYKNNQLPTAADLLNTLSEEEIANLIFMYGEERLSRKIAAKIVDLRSREKISSTGQIENICFHAYPERMRHQKIHPATRTFQALRIAVNEELIVLEKTIPRLISLLAPGGILGIISFHSLEDRIVKHKFKETLANHEIPVIILTKRPLVASDEELRLNSRSRSAKLRFLQREILRGS